MQLSRSKPERSRFWTHEVAGSKSVSSTTFNADIALAQMIEAELWRHYPGHLWHVSVDHSQGVAQIYIPALMGNHKYILHLEVLKTDPALRLVVRAAGEILERFNIPRASLEKGLDPFIAAKMRQDVRTRKWTPRAD